MSIDGGSTGSSEVVQDIALLEAQGGDRRQDAFDEATAIGALRAEAPTAPEYSPSQTAFCQVIGGFDTLDIDKGPQSRFQFQQVVASAAGLLMRDGSTLLQVLMDFCLNGLDFDLKFAAAEGAITHLMPENEELFALCQQILADLSGFSLAIHQFLEVPLEV